MTWRGQSSPLDRLFSALIYLLPLIDALPFGMSSLNVIPGLGQLLMLILSPLLVVYGFLSNTLPFFQLILLIVLLSAVVRNPRLSYFLRFNVMQAILIGIAVSIAAIVLQLMGTVSLGAGVLLLEALQTLVFFATLGAVVFSIAKSAIGTFPDLPWISEAAYSYLRY